MSKKVLLLSASAGAGHTRAADALAKVFQTQPSVGEVQHWDILRYTNAIFRHLYGRLYIDLVNQAPAMLGWFYDLSDTPYRNDKVRIAFEKLNSGRLIKAFRQLKPDIVVCTHFTPAAVLSWLVEKGDLPIKPAIVVTDFDCHAMWLVRHYQRYFVALAETKVYLERIGVRPDAVEVTGIPVDPQCTEVKDRGAMRRALGLDEAKFTILVSAGGFGVGPIERLITVLLSISREAQIVAIAGRSLELKSKLDGLRASLKPSPVTLHPVGFTNRMDDYMAAADILVGKAGGLTSSEALARGLPICIVNPIPGQEERNSDHLLEAGAAIRCNNLPTLAWKLSNLINEPSRLAELRQRATALGRPYASAHIVEKLLHSEVPNAP